MAELLDTMRVAIENSEHSRYSIAQATGVSEAALSRFVRGHSEMSVANIERVADHLGLEIVARPKRRRKAK